ncbi:MAG: glycosyltransferase family 4 protein [Bacteroidales bacterium]|nr:glycosyltransferase family 4 protein [Bacteroidales bacterium]
MKKRITIINQDSGYLMIEIANAYAKEGYKVSLIAGRLVQRNKPLNDKIKFIKIIRYNRSSTINRLFTWGVAAVQILFLLWFRFRKRQLLIVSNPPFAPLIPLLCSNNFSLLIYDVYPDALTEFGFFSSESLFIRCWKKVNIKVFKKAERIITITKGMQNVLRKYAGENPVEVIPIWTDNNFLKPVPKTENPFIEQQKLKEKFVVLYSGNLGYSHDVEAIIELAAIIDHPRIQFIIIGEGDKKVMLQQKIADYGLINCLMLPYQKPQDLPYSLSSADIAIVTLGKDASMLSVPSKTYNLMSIGAPLLCIADPDSELASLVNRYKIGQCFNSKKLDTMKKFVLELADNSAKLEKYRSNALKASKDFGLENAKHFIK